MHEAARGLLERVEMVVVTLGQEGACLFTRTSAWRATPHLDPAKIVKTVGCGDALLAGFVHAHARGGAPEECLRRGVAVGSAAALKARTGEADPEDAERLYATVEVTPMP
jgi:fructose-1-phosphate kinase PfkB-like protein